MSPYWMLEAALRSLVMGAAIFTLLKALRIRQVRAQRTAWVLALLAAIAMPLLGRWPVAVPLPAVHVPVHHHSAFVAPQPQGDRQPSQRSRAVAVTQSVPAAVTHPLPLPEWPAIAHSLRYAVPGYAVVVTLLLARLLIGLTLTLRLRARSTPSQLPVFLNDDIRISDDVRTPVTIGSTILLPAHSDTWSEDRLHLVLAHERAHVANADFAVHILGSLHCAIFWFSPFSWWLQRKLSALGEALSDLAALQQAESRSSYAEVLLELATSIRQPFAAIAMARSSSLRARIERILNDRLLAEAVSGTRRHPFLAASLVPVALLVSASLVRVHAVTALQPADAVPALRSLVAGKPSAAKPIVVAAALQEPAPPPPPSVPDPAVEPGIQAPAKATLVSDLNREVSQDNETGYTFGDQDGDSFALVYGENGRNGYMTFSGDDSDRLGDLRQKVKGDFIYYRHDGKSHVITDPALLAQVKALYAPIDALGKQQEELGRKQEALGAKQEALGRQQEAVNVPAPDLSKELARLDELGAKMKNLQALKTIDQESLSDLQKKMGELQGRIGELQGLAGEQQGRLGEQQGALGEEQGKLGEEQGRLGEQQGKLAEEALRKLKPMIEKAIRDGKAQPIN